MVTEVAAMVEGMPVGVGSEVVHWVAAAVVGWAAWEMAGAAMEVGRPAAE